MQQKENKPKEQRQDREREGILCQRAWPFQAIALAPDIVKHREGRGRLAQK